jgi:tetratricopeptide (TPR) repeat protein
MRTSEQFTRADLIRILNLSEKRLSQWEKLEFVARKDHYDFRDLIAVRTAKQLLENGVSPDRLRRSLRALSEKLTEVHAPLNELRITANGKDVIVEHSGGSQLEPLSGQFVMTFKTKELSEKVFTMPENPDAVFSLALEYDADGSNREKAAATYDRVLHLEPTHVAALLNRGTIAYEKGDLENAADFFRRAVDAEPDNAIALFNLGSVLDDLGRLPEARQHLRLASRFDPSHAGAHYNLAVVCEKLNARDEAREHFIAYTKLEPTGSFADYARRRI